MPGGGGDEGAGRGHGWFSSVQSVQSLDRLSRRGDMRDDSAEILFQSFLLEAILSSSGKDRDVHSLTLSMKHFLCPRGLTFTWWGCYGLCLDINQPSLPTPFYSDLVSISVFRVHSSVFHSIHSPDNSPLSHSVLLNLFLPYWSFQIYISL